MANSFLKILLEAKGDPKPNSRTPNDYTNNSPTAADPPADDDDTDTPAADTATDDTATDDDAPVDYTADAGDDPGDATDDTTDDTTSDDEASDYTEDGDLSADDSGDDTDTSSDDTTGQPPDPEQQRATENSRRLAEDFADMYYNISDTIERLEESNKDNITINSITNQVSKNLTILRKYLYEHIVYRMGKESYVQNLYKYDYFFKAFEINVQMLKKIGNLMNE